MGLQGESDIDSDEENEEKRQLRAKQQANRAAKLEEAKAESLQNDNARPLQPFFPKLYARYRPATLGEQPLIPEGMMELVHTLAENEFDVEATVERMNNLVQSRTQQEKQRIRLGRSMARHLPKTKSRSTLHNFVLSMTMAVGKLTKRNLGKSLIKLV